MNDITDTLAAPAPDTKAAEIPKKKRNPPRSPEERLKSLFDQLDKAKKNQTEAEQKQRAILRQIEKTKTDIQNNHIRGIYNVCKEKELSPAEASAFISALTDKMTFSEAAAKLGIFYKTKGSDVNAG